MFMNQGEQLTLFMESATENNRLFSKVRVKKYGKSVQSDLVIIQKGKPYLEQDKIGMFGYSFRFKHAGMSHR